jgi:hypothetical protein
VQETKKLPTDEPTSPCSARGRCGPTAASCTTCTCSRSTSRTSPNIPGTITN